MRRLGPQDDEAVLAALGKYPANGTLMEMHWRLTVQNPHMPHRFYQAAGRGGPCILKLSGRRAMLCGIPADGEELGSFLHFMRVDRLTSADWRPDGWPVLEDSTLLLRPPEESLAGVPAGPAPPPGFDPEPTVDEILQVLESTDGRISPEGVREGLWVDLHIRRNHGVAAVYGVRQAGRLVSTAGAWAITPAAAYVACVETVPEARGKGYAALLIRRLCADRPRHAFSLLCRNTLIPYYERLGFEATQSRTFITQNPDV